MSLDAQAVQLILNDIEVQYQTGQMDITQKLKKMIGEVECHISDNKDNSLSMYSDKELSSYEKAEKMLRYLERIECFKNTLDLFVRWPWHGYKTLLWLLNLNESRDENETKIQCNKWTIGGNR